MRCYLLYDCNTNKTIGVVKGINLDPNVFPEDVIGWQLVSEAFAKGHKVKAVKCPSDYDAALRRFQTEKPDSLDFIATCPSEEELDKRKERREQELRRQGRRSITDRIPDDLRREAVVLSFRGFSRREIADRLKISKTSVRRILEQEKSRNGCNKT